MQIILSVIALIVLTVCVYSQSVLPEPGICGVSAIKPNSETRIVNGETVIPHSRPYQLLLVGFYPNGTFKHYCGASLITSRHALTAAHCVVDNLASDIRIFTGLHNFSTDVLTTSNGIPVQKFVLHASYNSKTLANDVAVIRLQMPIEVDNIKVGLICIPTDNSGICTSGTSVVASGWGATSGNRTIPSRPTALQQASLKCVDGGNAECRRLTYTLSIIQDKTKLCAFSEYKGICFGDSGGPLVRVQSLGGGKTYLEQVGIMSGTVDCSLTLPRPDIYADVWYFRKWIADQVIALA